MGAAQCWAPWRCLPGAAGKVFSRLRCCSVGISSSPQLGLQSDFLACFLLFHMMNIIKTPAMRKRTDSGRKLLIPGTSTTPNNEKQNLSRESVKILLSRGSNSQSHTQTQPSNLCVRLSRNSNHRDCHECHTLAKPLATLFSLPNLEVSN